MTVSLRTICNGKPTFTFDKIIAHTFPKELIARVTLNGTSGETDVMFHVSVVNPITNDEDKVLITSNIQTAIDAYNQI